jgi:hypothetical protein
MEFFSLIRRLWSNPSNLAIGIKVRLRVIRLRLANKFRRSPVTDPRGPVVSLTTYGVRFQTVDLAIESIARGKILPSRLILWLDNASLLANLPIGIRRLQKRGLEIMLCENYGPHKKYYPYLELSQELEIPLVTADDDVLYPDDWLKKLSEAFLQYPNLVNCHMARIVKLNQESIGKYETWGFVDSTEPNFRHFAIGVGGVLYPPSLQREIKREGTAFKNCCPKADDIWLHAQAVRAGYKVRQVAPTAIPLFYIPGTQINALHKQNLAGGENDSQIKLTYRAADIDRLRESLRAPVGDLTEHAPEGAENLSQLTF